MYMYGENDHLLNEIGPPSRPFQRNVYIDRVSLLHLYEDIDIMHFISLHACHISILLTTTPFILHRHVAYSTPRGSA